jgi:hypothetical protein
LLPGVDVHDQMNAVTVGNAWRDQRIANFRIQFTDRPELVVNDQASARWC